MDALWMVPLITIWPSLHVTPSTPCDCQLFVTIWPGL
jgi:hypothetical protein